MRYVATSGISYDVDGEHRRVEVGETIPPSLIVAAQWLVEDAVALYTVGQDDLQAVSAETGTIASDEHWSDPPLSDSGR